MKKILLFFSLLFLSAVGLCSAAELSFAWTPNDDVGLAGYKIYYGNATRDYTVTVDVGNPAPIDGKVTYTVKDVPGGGTMYFAAVAYDTAGYESDYSDEVVVQVGLNQIAGFSAEPAGTAVTLSWLPNTSELLGGYKIHYGEVSGDYPSVVDVGLPAIVAGKVKYTMEGLTGGKTVWFTVTAYDLDGFESKMSAPAKAHVGIHDVQGFIVESATVTFRFIPSP